MKDDTFWTILACIIIGVVLAIPIVWLIPSIVK